LLKWSLLGQLPESWAEKAFNWYIKFLEVFFMISTSVTFTLAFVWFFPVYLKRGYEPSIVILLCIIALWLKYGTITIQFKE
jgi:hypothetical protein